MLTMLTVLLLAGRQRAPTRSKTTYFCLGGQEKTLKPHGALYAACRSVLEGVRERRIVLQDEMRVADKFSETLQVL